MTEAQKALAKLRERQSKERGRMAELGLQETLSDEQRSELDGIEGGTADLERLIRAATVAVEQEEAAQVIETRDDAPDGEERERRELRSKVTMQRYVEAALDTRAADGAEAEFNAALGIAGNRFPLELLAPERETRATTDADGAVMQGEWLDRLFAQSLARRVGISFRSAAPGIQAFPVTTAGGSAAQRGRGEAAVDAAWTVGVTQIGPTRNAIPVKYADEDALRLPGLEGSLRRDMGEAMMEGIDRAVFLGDDGANENRADIVGMTTAAGIVDKTLTQAHKVDPARTLAVFLELLDGKHAGGLDDLRIVTSVGCNTLWRSQVLAVASETASVFKTLGMFLTEQGLRWTARGEIDDATGDGDWGAFIGRGRGIDGAGVACVWNSGRLIRDPYGGAKQGEVTLTLSYFWGLAFPRASNFARLKFVA